MPPILSIISNILKNMPMGAAGRAAGRMLARAACGTMPTRLDEVMAATAFAAAAALGK